MRPVLSVLVGAFSLLGAGAILAAPAVVPPDTLVGKPLPEFSLQGLRTHQAGLSNTDFAGQPRLLNVFASWCSGCQEEAPMLQDIAAQGVAIFGVDWKDQPSDVDEFFRENGDPFARVGSSADGALVAKLGVTVAPQTLVIDRHGVVRYRLAGPITDSIWRETLQPLLTQLAEEK